MKFKKSIIRAVTTGIVLAFVTTLIGAFWLFNFSWRNISSESEMKENGEIVLQSSSLPDRFYEVYNLVNPDKREISMLEQTRAIIFPYHSVTHWDCKCDEIGYLAWNNKTVKIEAKVNLLTERGGYLKFGFGLEKYSNPKKCFDFWVNNSIYRNGNYLKDLNTLCKAEINKELTELNIDELILLIAWHDMLGRGHDDSLMVQERYKILKLQYERKASA